MTTKTRGLLFGAGLTLLLPLLGCSSTLVSPAESFEPAPTVAPAAPSDEALADYFSALASADPAELRRVAEEVAAPGSNAYAYAIEQAGVYQAYRDAGSPVGVGAMGLRTIDGGFEVCESVVVGAEEYCNAFTNLVHVGGRLADFDAGGTPPAGRISIGDGQSVAVGDLGTATFVAAYRSISGDVWVVIELRSDVDGLLVSYATSYRAPDGSQASPADLVGPAELRKGSLANYAFSFSGAQFGGVLTLEVFSSGAPDVTVEIPTA